MCRLSVMCAFLASVGLSGMWATAGEAASGGGLPATVFYVSQAGNDLWSGRQADPKGTWHDGPFRTLERARDAARELRRSSSPCGPIRIALRRGTYRLAAPVELTAVDSGTAEAPLVWEAYRGEKVVLSGGLVVQNWQQWSENVWGALLPEAAGRGLWFRQLYYGGRSQPRAVYPNPDSSDPYYSGWAYSEGPDQPDSKSGLVVRAEDVRTWQAPSHGEIDVFSWHGWNNNVLGVESVDPGTRVIRLSGKTSYPITAGNRYRLLNLIEELDRPGEWCLNPETGDLYFWPPRSPLGRLLAPRGPVQPVVVPRSEAIFTVLGGTQEGEAVRHVEFRGLVFAHVLGPHALLLRGTSGCVVRGCRFIDGQGAGIKFEDANTDTTITECEFANLGGAGVLMFPGEHGCCTDNAISYNHFHHLGTITRHVAAVYGGTSNGNVIAHNLIHHMPRYGISFKHGFGRNIIEYNEIRWTNLETNDTGAIESWQWMPEAAPQFDKGNVIRHNLIVDVIGAKVVPGGGGLVAPTYTWGIYMDDYSSRNEIEGNAIVRTVLGGICLHGGSDNVCRNNILVDGASSQFCYNNIEGKMEGNRSVNNIVVYRNGDTPVFSCGGFTDRQVSESDGNVLWNRDGKLTITGLPDVGKAGSWEEWRARGYDTHSVIADPMFVGARRGDYRLKSGSPALRLGFKETDWRQVGLRATPRWTLELMAAATRRVKLPKSAGRGGKASAALHPFPPVSRALRTGPGVAIDGRLGSEEWPAVAAGDRVLLGELNDYGGACSSPAYAGFMYDVDNLYVALVVPVSNAPSLPPKDDEAWGASDGAEVCLQRVPTRRKEAPPVFVLRGYTSGKLESSTEAGADSDLARSLVEEAVHAAAVSEDEWTAEYRIPWGVLGVSLGETRQLRLNVGVRKTCVPEWCVWVGTSAQNWRVAEAGLLALTPSVPATAPNLIRNGDLEDATEKGGYPAHWYAQRQDGLRVDRPAAVEPRLTWEDAEPVVGRCLALASSDPQAMRSRQGEFVQAIEGVEAGTYVLSYRVWADGLARARPGQGAFSVFLRARRSGRSSVRELGRSQGALPAGSMPWTRRDHTVKVPRRTGALEVVVRFDRMVGTVRVDGLWLRRAQ